MKKAHFRFHIILAFILLAFISSELFALSRGYIAEILEQNAKEDNFFQSPNKSFRSNEINPSALGNYYFYLVGTNKEVYAEYFQRIYPSITNPPKAWSKEMMKKLDLKLE